MKNLRYIAFLSLMVAILGFTACSDDDGPSSGSIAITVGGLPAGVDANITVTGPSGFSQSVTASETLSGLALGDYVITSVDVENNSTLYELSSDAVQNVTVTAGQTSSVTVAYGEFVPPTGNIEITISGLSTIDAMVTVSGPNGFSEAITTSGTLSGLELGDYTITTGEVNNAGQLFVVEDDDAEQEVTVTADQTSEVEIAYLPAGDVIGIVGKWYSAGDDVAPLLVTLFATDSIYAEFRDDMTYLVEQFDDSGAKLTLSGVFTQTASGTGTIYTIEVNQTSPAALTSEGIFQVTSEAPDVMQYEIVQTSPDIGATPPTAEAGFGSSSGGVLGTTNVQTYRRLVE